MTDVCGFGSNGGNEHQVETQPRCCCTMAITNRWRSDLSQKHGAIRSNTNTVAASTTSINNVRGFPAATLLLSGKVQIAGGFNRRRQPTNGVG